MNLLQLVDEPYDSGIVHYALTLARGLKRRGHRSMIGARPDSFAMKEAARLGLETFSVRRMPAGLLDLRRLIEKERVELVNAHTGSSHTLAVAATSLLGTPVLRTRADSRPLKRSRAGELLLGKTAGFIAPTDRILSEFQRAYPQAKLLSRVLTPADSDGTREASPEPPSPPYRIGILGRLDPVKGHASFLRAAQLALSQEPDVRFAVAGREENVKIADLRALALELGIEDRVEFLGHVADPGAFMSGCHVGVIASTGSEAISRAAIEWMAAGRPLVATEVGSLPELVENGLTGFLIAPDSPKIMSRRIVELLKDAALRARMGQAARERFHSRFTLERLAEQTELFYGAILLSSKGGKQ